MKEKDTPATITRRELVLLGIGASVLSPGFARADLERDVLQVTPRQTAGPFFPNRTQIDRDADLTRVNGRDDEARGDIIHIAGRVLTIDQQPIEGVVIDVWQANAAGRYAHEADRNPAPLDPNFQGWAQMKTDASGAYQFKTIMPGPYPVGRGWSRPPHIHFKLQRRGFRTLTTQMYFAGHPLNDADGLLRQHSPAQQRLLIVAFEDQGVFSGGRPVKAGVFNIVMDA